MRKDTRHAMQAAAMFVAAAGAAFLLYRHFAARRPAPPLPDYSGRSGFPAPPESMRGIAGDFEVPADFRTPELLRPLRRDQLH